MILLILGAAVLGVACLFMLPLLIPVVIFCLAILACVFWIWMLVDAIQNKGLGDGEKVGWVLAIVFLHVIGSVLYFIIGHPKRLTPRVGM